MTVRNHILGLTFLIETLLVTNSGIVFVRSSPTARQNQAIMDDTKSFETSQELTAAVDAYLDDPSPDSEVAQTYGWPIRMWHVEKIEDFSYLFSADRNPKAAEFNEDLDCWDTGSATTMKYMFSGASQFNGDVELFNTTQVLKMQGMFEDATSIDRDLSCWDVANVRDFSYMFHVAQSLRHGHLETWCTPCSEDMGFMFYQATKFNGDVTDWDVGGVRDFRFQFSDANDFDHDLCVWSQKIAGAVSPTKMKAMFDLTNCPDETEPGTGDHLAMCHNCDVPGPSDTTASILEPSRLERGGCVRSVDTGPPETPPSPCTPPSPVTSPSSKGGHSKGGSSKGGSSKGGSSKGGSSKGGSSKGVSSKGGSSKGGSSKGVSSKGGSSKGVSSKGGSSKGGYGTSKGGSSKGVSSKGGSSKGGYGTSKGGSSKGGHGTCGSSKGSYGRGATPGNRKLQGECPPTRRQGSRPRDPPTSRVCTEFCAQSSGNVRRERRLGDAA